MGYILGEDEWETDLTEKGRWGINASRVKGLERLI